MKKNAFISYSTHDDSSFRIRICDNIKAHGWTVWSDGDLSGGCQWWNEILKEIRNADVVVAVVSPNALKSEACKREWEYARSLDKTLLPIIIDKDVNMGMVPSKNLGSFHAINLLNPNENEIKKNFIDALNLIKLGRPLPLPLPTEPDLPRSLLEALSDILDQEKLTDEDQKSWLFDMREILKDSKNRSQGLQLLYRFIERTPCDLLYIHLENAKDLLEKYKIQKKQKTILTWLLLTLGVFFFSVVLYSRTIGNDEKRLGTIHTAPPTNTTQTNTSSSQEHNYDGIDFVWIPRGEFMMGSRSDEKDRESDEQPVHQVTIKKGFWLGKYEVTNAQFRLFNSAHNSGTYRETSLNKDKQPVVNVSWKDAIDYLTWLKKQSGRNYRLPTEAEWEYAARAGSEARYSFGDNEHLLCDYGNLLSHEIKKKSSSHKTVLCNDGYITVAPVGQYKPNAYHLYDMLGNVWEWNQDCWHDSYAKAPSNSSAWLSKSCSRRVLRGGSWSNYPARLRSAFRTSLYQNQHDPSIGFRIALSVQD